MLPAIYPHRSVLYVPGSHTRALIKARELPVDALIFDLEDAVAPNAKQEARQQIATVIQQWGYGYRKILVRVNGLDTPWGYEDLKTIAHLPINGVLLPKIHASTQIIEAVKQLNTHNNALAIWVMLETARGILNINTILHEYPHLTGIVIGTSDLGKEMRITHTPDRLGLLVPLSLAILAARAHNLIIVDGVHLDLGNDDDFKVVCQQARNMGFDGKTLIHPKQIATANQVFTPTEQEVTRARKIVSAWERAQQINQGVIVVDGQLVENLHVEEARYRLALAEICAARK